MEEGIVISHGNMGGHTYIFPAGEYQYVLDRSLEVSDRLLMFNADLSEEIESCAGSCWEIWGLLRRKEPLLVEEIVRKGSREPKTNEEYWAPDCP